MTRSTVKPLRFAALAVQTEIGGGFLPRISGALRIVPLALCVALVIIFATMAFGAVPAEYTQLAFLESSGTQYIDTGVVFGKTNGFSITYQVVAPDSTGGQVICGSRNDSGNTRCFLGSHSPSDARYGEANLYRRSLAYLGWNGIVFSKDSGSDYQVNDYTKGVADVNFRNSGTYDCRRVASGNLGELTAQTAPFYLFASKTVSPSETMYYGRCRIWEVRISAGSDIIRHFVAARRNSDSVLGMYDLVNGVFYTNQGTGTFVGGEPVQSSGRAAYTQLTWLESTGGQFIDTGVTFTDSHGFAVTYQTTGAAKSNNNQIVCGSRSSSGDTRCMVGSNDKNNQTERYAYVGWNTILTSAVIRDESEGTATINYKNSRTWDCRGQASGNLGTLATQTGSFYLFAGNMAYSGGSRIGCRCRIMSFTMTQGNEIVMDLIPVRRKVDGKPGMYDVLNDAFYVNQGSMDFVEGEPLFPDGYIGLDFIESTGTQYINTGVKCVSNVTMQAKVYNARPESKHFMGARTAYQQNALGLSFQAESGGEGYCVAWGSLGVPKLLGASKTVGVGDRFYDFFFGGKYIRMDNLFRENALSGQSFATDLDLFAFAVNNNGTPHNQTPSIRLSSLKIYKNGSLVRDYIPVMPTNSLAPGLYDLQNNVFYGNIGTGKFLAGEIVRGIDAPDVFAGEGLSVSEIAGTETATKSFAVRDTGLYRLWFQYKGGSAGGTGHSLAVQLDGQSLGAVTTLTTNGWTSANFDKKLCAGSHVLTIQGAGAGKSTIVDSVTLRFLRELPSGLAIFVR